jgi:hypothetical protein
MASDPALAAAAAGRGAGARTAGVVAAARRWLPAAAVAAACVPPLRGLWRSQGAPMEEGFMLVFPEMVLEGKVPNRDFLHLYGPGSLWVLAAVFAVFGTRLASERAVGFLQHLGVALGVYALVRPWGPWVAAGGGAIAAMVVITPSGLTAMAWIGGVALGLWALRSGVEAMESEAGTSRQKRLLAGAGLLGGAALLYRLDLVVAVGLSLGIVAWGLDRGGRQRLAAWSAVGVSPYLAHLAVAGVGNAIDGLVIEPVFDLRGGRRLPLPPSLDRYDGFLQGAQALNEPPWPLPAPTGPEQLVLWLGLLLGALALVVVAGVVAWRVRRDRRLLAIAAFCVGMLPQALQRADSTHLAWVSCVPLGVMPAAVVELARSRGTRTAPRLTSVAAVALPVAATLVLVPHYTWRSYVEATRQSIGSRPIIEEVIRNGDRVFPYKWREAAHAAQALIPVVQRATEPGDRVVVAPGDLRKSPYSEAFLYYLLPHLEVGTRYVEMDPGVANAEDSGLADELRAADVVILSTVRDDWSEPNDSALYGPEAPQEVLDGEFCLEASFGEGPFDPERGLYELYLRC